MRLETNYIRTYTGRKVWPLDLLPEDIDIVDIAHALSNQCRFTGHCRDFYSIAQHCLEVSRMCQIEIVGSTVYNYSLAGLLHDADEAYLVDLARPIKYSPGFEEFNRLGKVIEQTVFKRFGIPVEFAAKIKQWDQRAYELEREQFMPSGSGYDFVTPMLPREAERKFLERFYQLTCRGIGPNDYGCAEYGSTQNNEIRLGQTASGAARLGVAE